MKSASLNKSAKIISIIGHPLVFGNAYIFFMAFYFLERSQAWLLSVLSFGIISVPIIWNNWRKTKSGKYTNFDVSNQIQRRKFYIFALFLFGILLVTFWLLDFPPSVLEQSLIFFAMVMVMAFLNLWIKASMHTGIAVYISINFLALNPVAGIISLILSLAIAWSRWQLEKHDLKEISMGAFIGLGFGVLTAYLF